MNYKNINLKELKEELLYEPETGNFFWLVEGHGRVLGQPIGIKSTRQYQSVTFNGIACRMHRLAWFYMTGEWPAAGMVVDHKDGNPRNNKWDNLRVATMQQNAVNRRRRMTNLSGAKGVHRDLVSGLWKVQIIHEGKYHIFGPFETVEYAYKIHERESQRIRKEFHRPTVLRQQKATFTNEEVQAAIEEFIKGKVLKDGRYQHPENTVN